MEQPAEMTDAEAIAKVLSLDEPEPRVVLIEAVIAATTSMSEGSLERTAPSTQ